ncbi:MAG: metal ABC transporter permease [Chloroflexi bacterium]|nr:metal ABC transporter permease [Chloroflexota bacterium]
MVDFLVSPLTYAFMQRAFAAATIVGVVSAVLGTYVVLRGMAFMGDALAHAILPGVAVGYLVGGGARGPLLWWGMGAGVLAALGIGAISRRGHIREDTAIGVIFTGMFALGIVLISTAASYAADLTHFLFGDILGVGPTDLAVIGALGVVIVLIIVAFYKEFMVISFDPALAATLRIPDRFMHYLLLIMLATTIVVALQTVGLALMVAMLVTPAATASLLTRRLPTMMAASAGVGVLASVAGLYISYYANVPSGAAIVLVCTGLFVLAFLFAPRRGLVSTWLQRGRTPDAA